MITPARAAEILRLYHAEKWKPGTLARQLGVHHDTVRRVLAQAGQTPGGDATRPSLVDPFVPLIVMARERGYTGGPTDWEGECYLCFPIHWMAARWREVPELTLLPDHDAE